MPQIIEEFDWAATPLGPRSGWSDALRTTYDIMMGTGFATCATWGPEQTFIYNAAYIPFLGKRHPDALGKPIAEVWHDVWDDIRPLVAKATAGERVYMEDMHLVMTRNGYPEDTYWTFSYSPLRDGDQIMGMLDIAVETTTRVVAERDGALMMGETMHRLKNTLSVVLAIARQSLRGVSEKAAVYGFEQRLQALASAHDVLHRQDWSSADLEALIDAALAKLTDRSGYDLEGPPLKVSARVAQNVSLVFHELATNAIKHGAWSGGAGRVAVSWRLDAEQVRLEWRERGGPSVVSPEKKSFGSKLISGGLAGSGGVETHYHPEGLVVIFTATAESLLET